MEMDIDSRLLAHHGDAVRAVAKRAEAGDVVGVDVCVDRLDQLEVELFHELQVAIDLLQHGIDDQRLPAAPAGHEVAIGARNAVEELAEDHRATPLVGALPDTPRRSADTTRYCRLPRKTTPTGAQG
jgi:hypothetical protein